MKRLVLQPDFVTLILGLVLIDAEIAPDRRRGYARACLNALLAWSAMRPGPE
jgi:hypothetical protein